MVIFSLLVFSSQQGSGVQSWLGSIMAERCTEIEGKTFD